MCLHQTHLTLKELLNNTNLKKGETSVAKNQTNNNLYLSGEDWRAAGLSSCLCFNTAARFDLVAAASALSRLLPSLPVLPQTKQDAHISLTGIQHDVLNVFHHKHSQ